jgi:hypothetical protein
MKERLLRGATPLLEPGGKERSAGRRCPAPRFRREATLAGALTDSEEVVDSQGALELLGHLVERPVDRGGVI